MCYEPDDDRCDAENNMEIRLDPLHLEWVILAPVDHDFQTKINKGGYAVFENEVGTLTLNYHHTLTRKINPCEPGVLEIEFLTHEGQNRYYWRLKMQSFIFLHEAIDAFLTQIPQSIWCRDSNGDVIWC